MHIPRPEPLEVGARLGGYRLVERLCQDEQEATFRAEAEDDPSQAATLVQLLDAADPGVQARVRREAEEASALRHPHALGVLEVEVEGGQPYLRCEPTSGRRLQAALSGLEREERLARLREVAQALAAAHAAGVTHGDLHLGRIWLDEAGQARVSGWGLGWLWDRDRIGQRVPPRHVSPEQLLGQQAQIGPASDVWALGVLLFRLLSDRQPFDALGREELIEQIAAKPAPSLRTRDASVPRSLARLCARALAISPGHRYPDAGAFAADLERALAGQRVGKTWPLARVGLLVGLAPLLAWGGVQLAPRIGLRSPAPASSPTPSPRPSDSPSVAPISTLALAARELQADRSQAALKLLASVPERGRAERWRRLKGQAYLLLGDESSATALLSPNAVALLRIDTARSDLFTEASLAATREQLLEGSPTWLATVERLLPQRGVLTTYVEAGRALEGRLLDTCAHVLCELHEEAVALHEVQRVVAAAGPDPRFRLVSALWKLRLQGREAARATWAGVPREEVPARFGALYDGLGRALSAEPVSEPPQQGASIGTFTRQERWLYHRLRRAAYRRARTALVRALDQMQVSAEERELLVALSAHAEGALVLTEGFPDSPERVETLFAAAEARIASGDPQRALNLLQGMGRARLQALRRGQDKNGSLHQILFFEAVHQLGHPVNLGNLRNVSRAAANWSDPLALQAVIAADKGGADEAKRLLGQAARRRPFLFWRSAALTRREIQGNGVLEALRRK